MTSSSYNTIIIFTADHGDYAGEHGMMLKSGTFYDCMTRVPLIVSWPANIPMNEINEELVSNIDIMPTVMDFLGIEVNHPVHGKSLPGSTCPEGRAFNTQIGQAAPRGLYSDQGHGGLSVH